MDLDDIESKLKEMQAELAKYKEMGGYSKDVPRRVSYIIKYMANNMAEISIMQCKAIDRRDFNYQDCEIKRICELLRDIADRCNMEKDDLEEIQGKMGEDKNT